MTNYDPSLSLDAADAKARLARSAGALPAPFAELASSIASALDVDDPSVAEFVIFDRVSDLIDAIVALALAEARHQRIPIRIGQALERPSPGSMLAFASEVGAQLSERDAAFVELVRFLRPPREANAWPIIWTRDVPRASTPADATPRASAWPILDQLVAARNQWAHGIVTENRSTAQQLAAQVAALFDLASSADGRPTSLSFLAGARVQAEPGTKSQITSYRLVKEEPTPAHAVPAPRLALFSAAGARLLDLDPWLVLVSIRLPTGEDAELVHVVHRIEGSDFIYLHPSAAAHKLRGHCAEWAPVEEAPPPPAVETEAQVETPRESLGRGDTALSRFVGLVRRYLDRDARDLLSARFGLMGFAGDEEARFIEYCLERDLDELLEELFSEAALHRIARDLAITVDPLQARRQIVPQILRALDIPAPANPRGIGSIRDEVLRAASSLAVARDKASVRGVITGACSALERVLRDLVRFYGSLVLGVDVEAGLRDRRWLLPHQTLARSALGTLFELLAKIEARCFEENTHEAIRFGELFPGRPGLFGPMTAGERGVITKVRNLFSHANDTLDAQELDQLRRLGRDMFDTLLPFLEHLERNRIYPRVVAVREMVCDAFGRRFVRAVDDTGQEEKIFTERAMAPGLLYFMHPVTNPVRIYPILLEV